MRRVAMLPLVTAVVVLFFGYLFLGWNKGSYPVWFLAVLLGAIAFALIGRRVRNGAP
jgi:intracellular septation protein A